MKIGVVCIDERMEQIASNLQKDHETHCLRNEKDFENHSQFQVLVLPIKGVNKKGNINFFESKIEVHPNFWKQLKTDTKIFCGCKNIFLEHLPQTKTYYMESPKVIHDNAILTAEGVLNQIIECNMHSIYDVNIDIIGYGNCGRVIYEMLNNLQTNVRVVRRECTENAHFIRSENWHQCGDIIINTSHQNLMDANRMKDWKKGVVIIDIATPDVIDLFAAEMYGIKVIKAANLPARYASISAGNIVAEFIRGELKNAE